MSEPRDADGKNARDTAGIIAPPPLLTLALILAGFGAERFWPLPLPGHGPATLRLVASVAILLLACGIFVAAVRQLRGHHTTPNPYHPTTTVVSSGVYRLSRNPIYVAMMLLVLALALGAGTAWLFGSLVILFSLLHFGVVLREERYLSAKFGAAYDDYRVRVRRWL